MSMGKLRCIKDWIHNKIQYFWKKNMGSLWFITNHFSTDHIYGPTESHALKLYLLPSVLMFFLICRKNRQDMEVLHSQMNYSIHCYELSVGGLAMQVKTHNHLCAFYWRRVSLFLGNSHVVVRPLTKKTAEDIDT